MMSTGIAPARLPFAPRPISPELLSSWLLRVAAANCIDLWDLLHGLECRYGGVLTNRPIDFGLPDAAVQALSKFCQVAPAKIRALDLRQRSPYLSPALLLHVHNPNAVLMCSRDALSRVRYAFCPVCIASQRIIASLRWPAPLRRRFAAGLRYGTQKRWPNPPCRGTLGHWRPSEWERRELAVLYDLTSANRAEGIR